MHAEVRELIEETVRARMKRERRLGIGMAIALFGLLTVFQFATVPVFVQKTHVPDLENASVGFPSRRHLLAEPQPVAEEPSLADVLSAVIGYGVRAAEALLSESSAATMENATASDNLDAPSAESASNVNNLASNYPVSERDEMEKAIEAAMGASINLTLNALSKSEVSNKQTSTEEEKLLEAINASVNYTLGVLSNLADEATAQSPSAEGNAMDTGSSGSEPKIDEQALEEAIRTATAFTINSVRGLAADADAVSPQTESMVEELAPAPFTEADEEAMREVISVVSKYIYNGLAHNNSSQSATASKTAESAQAEDKKKKSASSSESPACECTPQESYLKDIFSWDEEKQVLTINPGTVEFSGSIVVRGYAGVENSVFVGGDPSDGEESTELAPGALLLYGKQGGDIAGFNVGEKGWKMSNVTISGELYEDDPDIGQPRRVSTSRFG